MLRRADHRRRPWGSLLAAASWAVAAAASGQSPAVEAPATAVPGAAAPAGGSALPYWQAPAVPQAVIQGGSIPPGWQPQAIPYHGIGPDGKPITTFVAPTYVFTYQSGPPVLAVPGGNRGLNRSVPAPPGAGWNYATTGAPPVNPALPSATVARYPPTPYQFPADSKALTGTPVVPPAGSAAAQTPPPTWAAAPAPSPVAAPPTDWVAAAPPPATATAPPTAPASGDWVTVVPPAVATAALAGAASSPATGSTPAQPVSTTLSQPPAAVTAPHLWRVVGVQDGDTLTCLDETNQQQRVRLADIDAPDLAQDFGKESREALAAMVFGKTVEVSERGRDDAGRWVSRVVVDGVDVNRQMVATGNAWSDPASSDPALPAVQSQAQSQRAGLWAGPSPTPPWVFRQGASAP